MVEVFITDIKKQTQVKKMVKTLKRLFSELKISFDMDETGLPFPQGHTVLRAEGEPIDANAIVLQVKKSGFMCDIMEDMRHEKTSNKTVCP
ncbi:hypothetical protein [Maribacter sp. 2307UL18-2]|uniref:hypothetical protein n=1 Tax=Maribacter sp. 2307UL18-2 TaxID=3386274 RepID=UPI0039BD300E